MRRAMPYPCRGPSVCSVFSTISASVPCQTSFFSLIALLWVTHTNRPTLPARRQWQPTRNTVSTDFFGLRPCRRFCGRCAKTNVADCREPLGERHLVLGVTSWCYSSKVFRCRG